VKTISLDLQEEIIEELAFDPRIASEDVAVTAAGGVVTLRGTVPSLAQKWDVEDDVKRIRGVRGIVNEIVVDLPQMYARTDTTIAQAIERRFESNSIIPSDVQFVVADGTVTLTGKVAWHFQAQEAAAEARRVTGVRDVFNVISVEPDVVATQDDIKRKIHSQFARAADIDANGVDVAVDGATVKLTGTVRTWLEHDKATQAAWSLPGVKHVDNRIDIVP